LRGAAVFRLNYRIGYNVSKKHAFGIILGAVSVIPASLNIENKAALINVLPRVISQFRVTAFVLADILGVINAKVGVNIDIFA